MSALSHLKSARSAAIDALEESDWKDETARRAAYLADAAIREIEFGIPAHPPEVIEAVGRLDAVLDGRCEDCGSRTVTTPKAASQTHDGELLDLRECPACGWAEAIEGSE